MPIKRGSGRYNVRVAVHSATTTLNPDGQIVESGSSSFNRSASVIPVNGTERFAADQNRADITHRVRMHRDGRTAAITPENWLMIGTKRLDIIRVFDVDMRRVEIEIEAKEHI